MFIKPAFLILLFLSIIALIYSCTSTDSKSADIVFRNGYIFTVDSSNSKAEALAIKDGEFVFIGRLERYTHALAGGMVLPCGVAINFLGC